MKIDKTDYDFTPNKMKTPEMKRFHVCSWYFHR